MEQLLERIDTVDCWKILVEVVPNVETTRVRNLLGAYAIEVAGDAESVFNTLGRARKERGLELLMKGVREVCRQMGWEERPFAEAARRVVEENFENSWVWKKPKSSPDRKHRAWIECDHGPHTFRITMAIRDASGREILRRVLKEERPSEFAFVPYLGTLKWLSREEVALFDKQGRLVGSVDLQS